MELEILLNNVKTYNRSKNDLLQIGEAYEFAKDLHHGQERQSGEAFIIHPLAVAIILSEMRADTDTIIAGLLHDTIEDTSLTKEDISEKFNPFIADLVEGVTRLGRMDFSSKDAEFAANTKKLMKSVTEEIRVILIKLADRLHNMRTLEYIKPEKQLKKSLETRDIFAPIADRIGCYKIKRELEDLSFKYLEPEEYYNLEKEIAKVMQSANDNLKDMSVKIEKTLTKNKIKSQTKLRVKSSYQIHQRINEGYKLHEMYDLIGLIITVENEEECYKALGIIHSIYKTTNRHMRDYIYQPKINMYQSIHSTVFGEGNHLVQIRIRTEKMDETATFGFAAYWQDPDISMNETIKKSQLYESLIELDLCADNVEYLKTLKQELGSKMYVFTTKGKLIKLPLGSTAVDFAYKIHSDIGNTMIGAIINGEEVEPERVLKHKDVVQIITEKDAVPDKNWIKSSVTPLARRKIEAYYKK